MPGTTSLNLPTDAQNQRTWGTLDETTHVFSLLRARFTEVKSINGQNTQIADMGVVPVGHDGTKQMIIPMSVMSQSNTPFPSPAGSGLSTTLSVLALSVGGSTTAYSVCQQAKPDGSDPTASGLLASVHTVWDVLTASYKHVRSAASQTGDNDPGSYYGTMTLRAWNGTGYSRLRADAQNNLMIAIRDAAGNPAQVTASGALKVDTSTSASQTVNGTMTVVQATAANLNTNVSGSVAISTLPPLPTGANIIGQVLRATVNTASFTAQTAVGPGTPIAILPYDRVSVAVYASTAADIGTINVEAADATGGFYVLATLTFPWQNGVTPQVVTLLDKFTQVRGNITSYTSGNFTALVVGS